MAARSRDHIERYLLGMVARSSADSQVPVAANDRAEGTVFVIIKGGHKRADRLISPVDDFPIR